LKTMLEDEKRKRNGAESPRGKRGGLGPVGYRERGQGSHRVTTTGRKIGWPQGRARSGREKKFSGVSIKAQKESG